MSETKTFSLEDFYHKNRRVLIWVIFLALLFLLRDFFTLIFLTYVLALLAARLMRLCMRYLHLSRRPSLLLIYGFFVIGLTLFATIIVPRVIGEADALVRKRTRIQQSLLDVKQRLLSEYPIIDRTLMSYLAGIVSEKSEDNIAAAQRNNPPTTQPVLSPASRSAAEDERILGMFLSQQGERVRAITPIIFNRLYNGTLNTLLALLFSFLIMLDFARLSKDVQSLRQSRLHDFYEQTAQPVVRFAWVVGQTLEAQAVIALTNTVLTFIGLLFLNIPSLAVLSLIVFLCSFVPVLGVFISTIPIVLIALNSGGIVTASMAIVLIIAIHLIEAYLLNPLIYGHHLKLNPVLILIILLVGHHAFGLWGMLLGVPVTYYFIHDVFGVPVLGERVSQKQITPPPESVEERI